MKVSQQWPTQARHVNAELWSPPQFQTVPETHFGLDSEGEEKVEICYTVRNRILGDVSSRRLVSDRLEG